MNNINPPPREGEVDGDGRRRGLERKNDEEESDGCSRQKAPADYPRLRRLRVGPIKPITLCAVPSLPLAY